METTKKTTDKTIFQKLFIVFQILTVAIVGNTYFYVRGGGLPYLAKLFIVLTGSILVLTSYCIRKKIPLALWLVVLLTTFAVFSIIYANTNIYILARRDNTINVIDHGWAFVRPFSCKKIYSIPKSKTLKLESALVDSDYQKKITGKFEITLNIVRRENSAINYSSEMQKIKNGLFDDGLFEIYFEAFIYKDCEEIKKAILQNQETYPAANLFCGCFHPQSYQLIDNLIINWDGELKITGLKITPMMLL